MANNRQNFVAGIGIVPNTSTTANTSSGDLEYLTSDGKLHVFGASANDAIVQEALAATLTNKSISGSTNTLTSIANGSLTNSSITINGTSVSLGGSITVTATATAALTLGTGLTGTSYNGSTPVTTAIDTTVVATLTGTQTLTNKTLTAPVINNATADAITAIASGNLTITNSGGYTSIDNLKFVGSTISTVTGDLTIAGNTNSNVFVTAPSTGYVQLQRNGITYTRVGTGGLEFITESYARFYDSTTTNYVGIRAPTSVTASYTVTLPTTTPAASTALVFDGTNYVWSSAGGWATASSTSLAANGTITLGTNGQQFIIVAGASAPITLSVTPFGTSGFTDGMVIRLVGNSQTNTVTLLNNDASNGCIINGNITLFKYNSIELQYSSTFSRFVEITRNV